METSGQWEPIPQSLTTTQVHHCDVCGKMLVRRMWRVEYQDRKLGFCDEPCERMWFEYWLPRYGDAD